MAAKPIISPKSVAEFTEWLMSFESTTDSEATVAEPLAQWLGSRDWSVLRQPISGQPHQFNLLATRQASKSPALLFNSHLDTVPPYIGPELEGNVLKGRGSCDAKGQVAAMIFAAEKLAANSNIANRIGLLFVVGEETNHIGMKEANKLGLNPKFLIVGEPTEMKFATRQKGMLKIELKSQGKAAHSGYPEMGVSALDPLLGVIQDLRATLWPGSETLGQTTMNIGLLNAGQASNAVPASAQALLCFRVVTDPDSLLDQIKSIVAGRVKIEVQTANPPADLKCPEGYESTVVAFNTDIPYFDAHKTTDCYLFGAGSIKDAHSEWEFVNLDDLQKASDTYYDLARKLLS